MSEQAPSHLLPPALFRPAETYRILLIEDNLDHQLLERKALEELGAGTQVIAVTTAIEGLEALGQQDFDLILADYQMPGMDGLEFLRVLNHRRITTPVVIVTGLGNERVAVAALKQGARDYIIKESGYLDLLPSIAERAIATVRTQRQLDDARRRLAQSEERYRELVNDLDAIVWEADPVTWQFSFVSQRAEKILGYPIERWLTEPDFWVNLIHPEDRDEASEYCRRAIAERRDHEFKYRSLAADGRVVWLRDIVRVVCEGETVTRLRGLMVDFTEQEQTEEDIQRQKKYLESLIRYSPLAIATLDVNHRLVSCNPAFEHLFQYRQAEIRGQNLDDLLTTEETVAEAWAWTDRVLSGGTIQQMARRRRKDGAELDVEVFGMPVIVDGEHVRVLALYYDITERRRAEIALRVSEEKFSKAFRASPDGITISTLTDGRYIEVNDGFLRATGYDREEVIGRTAIDLNIWSGPEDRTKVIQLLREQGAVHNLEVGFRIKSGEARMALFSAEIIDIGGQLCMLAIINDITERQRAETALRQSEERFRKIFEDAPIGMAIVGLDYKLVKVNKALCEMLGYTEQELSQRTFIDITHPEDIQQDVKYAEQVFKGQATGYKIEKRYVNKNQETLWVNLTATGIRDQDGSIVYGLGMVENITERKRTEMALREAEARYRDLYENANDIIYTHDLHGHFTSVNRAGLQAFGYELEEVLQRDIITVVDPEYLPLAKQKIREKMLNKNSTSLYELLCRTKDGRPIWLEVSTRLIEEEGKPVGIQGIARNITERKQAEEENQRLQQQLLQAQKMESIGTLAGGIAHDFNNLLQGILGYASLTLQDINPQSASYRYLRTILESAERAANLTTQMLTFSRRKEPQVEPVDINRSVEESLRMLRHMIPTTIDIQTWQDPALWTVQADATQIQQVLVNLCINARDAMPAGGTLTIETENRVISEFDAERRVDMAPGRYVILTVSDTGVGMTPTVRERIFEPFFTTKGIGEGTGLGLAVAYGIVQSHKGWISVYSEPGQGSVFRIHLPASEKKSTTPESAVLAVVGGSETILVVDDEPVVLRLACDILTSYGYFTLTARDGEEALQVYQERRAEIDLVLLDLTMPKLSGMECARRLRSLNSSIRVIASSGYSAQTKDVLEKEVQAFVPKPYSPKELARVVRTVLDESDGLWFEKKLAPRIKK
jgi:PAS domain S-box-containing protein